jgi:hypothetical protein
MRSQLRKSLALAETARAQADATSRQGKTIMVFTIITIIFVRTPLPNKGKKVK